MELPVRLVIASHLSDIQEESIGDKHRQVINFIKHLVFEFPNTYDEIDVDAEWERFKVIYPNMFN